MLHMENFDLKDSMVEVCNIQYLMSLLGGDIFFFLFLVWNLWVVVIVNKRNSD